MQEEITIDYLLELDNGEQRRMVLAEGECEDIESRRKELPAWTELGFHQCRNCPLNKERHPYCPVAANLVDLLELSNGLQSYAEVRLTVTVPERQITASTTVQRAVSSLLGLVMATSACPHTQPLRPMARFHLPLASEEETLYRSASMYLLAQYFLNKQGAEPDLELHGLREIYHNLQIVNAAMAARLRPINNSESTVNSLVLLDVLAKALPHSLDDSLEDIRYLFTAYLK